VDAYRRAAQAGRVGVDIKVVVVRTGGVYVLVAGPYGAHVEGPVPTGVRGPVGVPHQLEGRGDGLDDGVPAPPAVHPTGGVGRRVVLWEPVAVHLPTQPDVRGAVPGVVQVGEYGAHVGVVRPGDARLGALTRGPHRLAERHRAWKPPIERRRG